MKWIRIDEASERSHLTKADNRRLKGLVMKYAWNCWYAGDQMFPWEDVENDYAKGMIDDLLDGMTH